MFTHIAVGIHVADTAAREGSPHNVLHSSSTIDRWKSAHTVSKATEQKLTDTRKSSTALILEYSAALQSPRSSKLAYSPLIVM